MAISNFMPSINGMDSQSQAMSRVSTNIANISTVGYKPMETMFSTLLGNHSSSTTAAGIDVATHGVRGYDRNGVDRQGEIIHTGNPFDVAINGTGNAFFMLKSDAGETLFTRAGNFGRTIKGEDVFLTTPNGMKVQGYKHLGGEGFSSLHDDILMPPEKMDSVATTEFEISANVPASGVNTSSYGMTIYGPNNEGQTSSMLFRKVEGELNTWEVSFSAADGVVTSEPQKVYFGSDGKNPKPTTLELDISWNENAGGGENSVTVDISKMTQFSASSGIVTTSQNGNPSGDLRSAYIDEDGILQAKYSNEHAIPIAKLTLASFPAPNSLIPKDDTTFMANKNSGQMFLLDSETNRSYIQSQALEQSAVNLEDQFSKMILVQQAYSMNSQSFTVTDEMLEDAVNLRT
ncbi:MAG: flagellar hook-basal body complex protein [Alphaproteobacteria bacterium]